MNIHRCQIICYMTPSKMGHVNTWLIKMTPCTRVSSISEEQSEGCASWWEIRPLIGVTRRSYPSFSQKWPNLLSLWECDYGSTIRDGTDCRFNELSKQSRWPDDATEKKTEQSQEAPVYKGSHTFLANMYLSLHLVISYQISAFTKLSESL